MKVFVFVVLPILAIGGFVGMALTGVIDVPGLTPKHTKAKPVSMAALPKAPNPISEGERPARKPKVQLTADRPKEDPDQGASELAEVWNEMDGPKIAAVIKTWKEGDAARVLLQMDGDKAAEVLDLLDPKQASRISQLMEKQGSLVVED